MERPNMSGEHKHCPVCGDDMCDGECESASIIKPTDEQLKLLCAFYMASVEFCHKGNDDLDNLNNLIVSDAISTDELITTMNLYTDNIQISDIDKIREYLDNNIVTIISANSEYYFDINDINCILKYERAGYYVCPTEVNLNSIALTFIIAIKSKC